MMGIGERLAHLGDLDRGQARVAALVAEGNTAEGNTAEGTTAGALRPLPILLSVGLTLLAFCATLAAIRSQVIDARPGAQFEGASVEAAKRVEYGRRSSEFDTVFVGNSRVLNHFNTGLFDQETATAGVPTRSFNFGLAGLRHPESMATAEWILNQGEPHLRTLIVEVLGELTHSKVGALHEQGIYTRRAVEWHDLARTRLVSSAILEADVAWTEKCKALYVHWHHFALRQSNLGALVEPLLTTLGLREPSKEFEPWEGFLPVHLDPHARKIAPDAIHTRIQGELRDMRWTPGTAPDALLSNSYAELVELAQSKGVKILFVLFPPHFYGDVDSYSADNPHGLPALIDYRNPTRFPQFFDSRAFYNYGHYTLAGANRVTRRLALDFSAWVKSEESGGSTSGDTTR